MRSDSTTYTKTKPLSKVPLEAAASDTDLVVIGKRMQAARLYFGLTQVEFAKQIGGSKPGIQDNESGKNMPGGKVISSLIRMGINANWLLVGEGPMLLREMKETTPPPSVDASVLATALKEVEQALEIRRLQLTPAKKARLISVLYDYVKNSGNKEPTVVDQLLDLIS